MIGAEGESTSVLLISAERLRSVRLEQLSANNKVGRSCRDVRTFANCDTEVRLRVKNFSRRIEFCSSSRRSGNKVAHRRTSCHFLVWLPVSLPVFLPRRRVWRTLLLGQFLSGLLCATGVTSQILSTTYNVYMPTGKVAFPVVRRVYLQLRYATTSRACYATRVAQVFRKSRRRQCPRALLFPVDRFVRRRCDACYSSERRRAKELRSLSCNYETRLRRATSKRERPAAVLAN